MRKGPRNVEASRVGRRTIAIAADNSNPDTIQSPRAIAIRAIQRHTGVSKTSNVTSGCGNFF
jgi:hypothetical protein